MEKFGTLWSFQKICNLKLPFEQILSYRNMEFFCQFFTQRCVPMRKAITEYLIFTINHDLLLGKRLLSQILRFGRREWPIVSMNFLIFGRGNFRHDFVYIFDHFKKILFCRNILRALKHVIFPQEVLIEMSTCLNDVLQSTKSGHGKIESALQWLANFISEDNDFY